MTIPSELQRGIPRQVSLTAGGWKVILSCSPKATLLIGVVVWIAMQAGRGPGYLPSAQWLWRFGAGLLFAAIVGSVRIRRQVRLLIYGRVTTARVIGEAKPWWAFLFRRWRGRLLQCEFRLLSGGLCRTTVEAGGKIPAPNAEIVVVYDPDEPAKATIYPARMLKVDGGSSIMNN